MLFHALLPSNCVRVHFLTVLIYIYQLESLNCLYCNSFGQTLIVRYKRELLKNYQVAKCELDPLVDQIEVKSCHCMLLLWKTCVVTAFCLTIELTWKSVLRSSARKEEYREDPHRWSKKSGPDGPPSCFFFPPTCCLADDTLYSTVGCAVSLTISKYHPFDGCKI